jgi:hypothetical protein
MPETTFTHERPEMAELKGALRQIAEDCGRADWDGARALPVSDATCELAAQVLDALPLAVPLPTLGAEPDGQVTLDWHRGTRQTVSVSVSEDGELHYAALLGRGKAWGTEPFEAEFPVVIAELVRRLYAA